MVAVRAARQRALYVAPAVGGAVVPLAVLRRRDDHLPTAGGAVRRRHRAAVRRGGRRAAGGQHRQKRQYRRRHVDPSHTLHLPYFLGLFYQNRQENTIPHRLSVPPAKKLSTLPFPDTSRTPPRLQ